MDTEHGLPGEHLEDDRLCDLVLGYLSGEERTACLSHLRRCPECEENARRLASAHARARAWAHAHLTAGPLPLDEAAERTGTAAFPLRRPDRRLFRFLFRPLWALPVALTAVLALALIIDRTRQETPGGPDPQWLIDPSRILITNRVEGAPGPDPLLSAGFEAYARRDLDTAISSLGRAKPQSGLEPLRRAYLGSALLWKGRPVEALPLLRSMGAEEIPGVIRPEVRWTLMVALARAGNVASAESLRTRLAAEGGEIGERARRAHFRR